jgi:hypothetical protein
MAFVPSMVVELLLLLQKVLVVLVVVLVALLVVVLLLLLQLLLQLLLRAMEVRSWVLGNRAPSVLCSIGRHCSSLIQGMNNPIGSFLSTPSPVRRSLYTSLRVWNTLP